MSKNMYAGTRSRSRGRGNSGDGIPPARRSLMRSPPPQRIVPPVEQEGNENNPQEQSAGQDNNPAEQVQGRGQLEQRPDSLSQINPSIEGLIPPVNVCVQDALSSSPLAQGLPADNAAAAPPASRQNSQEAEDNLPPSNQLDPRNVGMYNRAADRQYMLDTMTTMERNMEQNVTQLCHRLVDGISDTLVNRLDNWAQSADRLQQRAHDRLTAEIHERLNAATQSSRVSGPRQSTPAMHSESSEPQPPSGARYESERNFAATSQQRAPQESNLPRFQPSEGDRIRSERPNVTFDQSRFENYRGNTSEYYASAGDRLNRSFVDHRHYTAEELTAPFRPMAAPLRPIMTAQTKTPKRPTFDEKTDPIKFIDEIEKYGKEMNLTPVLLVEELSRCFSDTMATWFRDIRPRLTSWKHFVEEFHKICGTDNKFAELRMQTMMVHQHRQEDLVHFVLKKWEMFQKFYPHMLEAEICDTILQLVKPSYNGFKIGRTILTFNALREWAIDARKHVDGQQVFLQPTTFSTSWSTPATVEFARPRGAATQPAAPAKNPTATVGATVQQNRRNWPPRQPPSQPQKETTQPSRPAYVRPIMPVPSSAALRTNIATGSQNSQQRAAPVSTNKAPQPTSILKPAAAAVPTGNRNVPGLPNRPPVVCFLCKNQGHYSRDCPKRNQFNIAEVQDALVADFREELNELTYQDPSEQDTEETEVQPETENISEEVVEDANIAECNYEEYYGQF
jgi:Zinc knuckle